jgi:hypothetical protein
MLCTRWEGLLIGVWGMVMSVVVVAFVGFCCFCCFCFVVAFVLCFVGAVGDRRLV